MTEYTIIAKVKEWKNSPGYAEEEVLVCLAGYTKERAEAVLERVLTHKDHARNREKYYDFKINEEKSENCWWNYGTH